MVVGLAVHLRQGLLQVLVPPHEALDVCDNQLVRTLVLEQILVLLDQLLSPEPAVLVEEVDFGDLRLVLAELAYAIPVGEVEEGGIDDGEEVPQRPEADVGGEDVVVVGVEELRRSGAYQIAGEGGAEQRVAGVLHDGHGHDIVPLGCISCRLRSYGSSVNARSGNWGLRRTAMLIRSTIFFTLL